MRFQHRNLMTGVIILSSFIFHIAVLIRAATSYETKSFGYDGFDDALSSFKFEGSNSGVSNDALQLTPESRNEVFTHNKAGRIMYADPFRLWLSDDDRVASFNTTFVINIYRESTWEAGHGLAFLIAPNVSIPDSSYGQWLGLTNDSTDGNPANHIVAIEFDTLMQEGIGDPDRNHIGLNINSVRSNKTVPLNFTLSPPPPGVNYSIWIQYNGSSKVMKVFMEKEEVQDMPPSEPLLRETIDLRHYLKQESYFGFAASTGNPEIELNCVLKWSLQIERQPEGEDKTTRTIKIGVGVGVPVVTALLLIGLVYYCKRRKSSRATSTTVLLEQSHRQHEMGRLRWLPGMPREFKFKELKKATNNFHHNMKLGEGGFGVVYKGVLPLQDNNNSNNINDHQYHHYYGGNDSTPEIAVKKFSRDNIKSKDDFLAELTIIHRLRHKHLVRLVGWCHEKGKLLLVYEFMPNGSLEKHLYQEEELPERDALNWSRRYKILTGVASALHYLHKEYDQKVVHRDLKASNILLDLDFNARLGDFGLARALENERNSYAELGVGGVPGTMGYIAPECFHTGRATPESDVYGFGAVVLEVVCGRRPGIKIQHNERLYPLVDWVWMLHREGGILEAVDERLKNDFVEDEAKRLLLLGLACSHPIDTERPTTPEVLQIISGTLPAPRVPPFKPAFTWPSVSTTTTATDNSLTGSGLSTQLQRSSSQLPV